MSLSRIDSLVQFTPGYKKVWIDESLPVPDGLYVYDDETGDIKIGNGVDLFADLDVWLNTRYLRTNNSGIVIDFSKLGKINIPDDIDKIFVVNEDEDQYVVSSLKVSDIDTFISNSQTIDTNQDTALTNIGIKTAEIDHEFVSGEANKMTAIKNQKIEPLDVSLAENKANVVYDVQLTLYTITLNSVLLYSDESLTTEITNNTLDNKVSSYLKLDVTFLGNVPLDYQLTSDNEDVIITYRDDIEEGVFEIDCRNVTSDAPITLSYVIGCSIPEIDDVTGSNTYSIDIHMLLRTTNMRSTTDSQILRRFVQDSNGNIYSVGHSPVAGGQGSDDGFVVKYDENMNIIKQVLIGTNEGDSFNDICIDNNGYLYAVGTSYLRMNDTSHANMAWVVKYDTDLNLIQYEVFEIDGKKVVLTCCEYDTVNNKLVVGGYTVFSSGSDCILIATLDSNLNTLAHLKIIDGWDTQKFNKIAIDYTDPANVYYIGVGYVRTSNNDGYLAKLDTNLTLIKSINYSGASSDYFNDIKILSNGKYLICGDTYSEGNETYNNPYVAIYNPDLTVDTGYALASHYGGHAYFISVAFDSLSNMIYGFGNGDFGPFISQFSYTEDVGISYIKTKKFIRQDGKSLSFKYTTVSNKNTILFSFFEGLDVTCSSLGELKQPLQDGTFVDIGAIYEFSDATNLGAFYNSEVSIYDSTSEVSIETGVLNDRTFSYTSGLANFNSEHIFIGE